MSSIDHFREVEIDKRRCILMPIRTLETNSLKKRGCLDWEWSNNWSQAANKTHQLETVQSDVRHFRHLVESCTGISANYIKIPKLYYNIMVLVRSIGHRNKALKKPFQHRNISSDT